MAEYPLLGVKPIDKHHQSEKENQVGIAPIDGNRMFTSTLGNQAMGATSRQNKAGDKDTINRAKPGGFKVRKRTLKG